MKVKLSTICFFIFLILTSFACSNSNQNANNSSAKVAAENENANRDFTNRPVNLNNPKEKAKFDKLIVEFNKNRSLWKSNNISDYDYFCEVFGGGMTVYNPAIIKVRENKTFSVEEVVKSQYHKQFNLKGISPYEEMFDSIQKQLEMGCSVNVKYHKKYGYPEEWWAECISAFDSYSIIRVSKFEIIK